MTQLAIEALLRQKTGLDATVFASDMVVKAVQSRMAERGISEISVYLNQLHRSVHELEALIEAVIVPETWFFRDKEPFVLLQNYGLGEWRRTNPKRMLRVLSVPCSTGEEPYSIAIALMEAGLSPDQFQIDAIDISRRSLRVAQQAIYENHSFRGTDLAFQQRYFTQTTIGTEQEIASGTTTGIKRATTRYYLCEAVRQSVRFQYGNLVDPTFAIDKIPYDVIFCRNLLIYFDSRSRERSIQVLNRLLNPQGLLFVGHAETALLPVAQFTLVRHPFAFAHRKVEQSHPIRAAVQPSQKTTADRPIDTANVRLAPNLRQPQLSKERVNKEQTSKEQIHRRYQTEPQPQDLQQDLLSTAKVLANQGCLQEAAQQCQAYLNQHRTSSDAYVLLGQVHQALGQELQAEQCFQKALYLNPKNMEALVHLALLLEQQGDLNSAATIRQRIQRLL